MDKGSAAKMPVCKLSAGSGYVGFDVTGKNGETEKEIEGKGNQGMTKAIVIGGYIFKQLLKKKYAVVICDKLNGVHGWEFYDLLSDACNRAAELAKEHVGKRVIVLEAKEVLESVRL